MTWAEGSEFLMLKIWEHSNISMSNVPAFIFGLLVKNVFIQKQKAQGLVETAGHVQRFIQLGHY